MRISMLGRPSKKDLKDFLHEQVAKLIAEIEELQKKAFNLGSYKIPTIKTDPAFSEFYAEIFNDTYLYLNRNLLKRANELKEGIEKGIEEYSIFILEPEKTEKEKNSNNNDTSWGSWSHDNDNTGRSKEEERKEIEKKLTKNELYSYLQSEVLRITKLINAYATELHKRLNLTQSTSTQTTTKSATIQSSSMQSVSSTQPTPTPRRTLTDPDSIKTFIANKFKKTKEKDDKKS